MRSSPRAFAERFLEKCHAYGLVEPEHYPLLLSLAEDVIREAVAFELNWLAEYLAERAKREGGPHGDGGRDGEPPSTTAITRPRPRQ